MRDFITGAEESERCLDRMVAALHLMMSDRQFCALMVSEGLETMPRLLAHRLPGAPPEPHVFCPPGKPLSDTGENREPIGGICPGVLDVLRDAPVKTKIFGLLQKVLPARQVEIARLMVAMDQVRLTYARMLVALTPQALLVKDFHPSTIANLTEGHRGAMVLEVGKLSLAVLGAMEQRGQVGLELVAASRFFARLMDNSRVVRYLARNYPGHFEEFHNLSEPFIK
ncbi:msr9757 (plasmid) [Mesorhizobium japonicum MAFF 303099]|uniref:Msr9757 protein n=2 Tax=Mesorhizobium japonicum TaxID=2066070 RepID=Q98P91_RHILO|nr:msr9757 [Mesorhizobium japonicum MAFF 303099]